MIAGETSIPQCEINPCKHDGYVPFQNRCQKLNERNGCEDYEKLLGRKVQLVVDPTSLQLTCRDEDDKFRCANFCCIGSQRYNLGRCPEQPKKSQNTITN